MDCRRWWAAGLAGLASMLIAQCASMPQPEMAGPVPSTAETRVAVRLDTPTPKPVASEVPSVPTAAPPTALPTHQPTSRPTMVPPEEVLTVTFTIVYDNNAYAASEAASVESPALRTAWGFACWVEAADTTLLFDTGGDGATLMANLEALGLDPKAIDAVVLSHAHGDHTGGLMPLLGTGIAPTVYVPASFPAAFKRDVRRLTDLVEVKEGVAISPAIYTTGEVGSSIIEQALVVETEDGLVVITGCAHPGVVEMVRRAKEIVADRSDAQGASDGVHVALVLGGFHLGSAARAQVEAIIEDFRGLGVQRVAPCHCTGDQARRLFADSFGPDCFLAGVGWSTQMVLHE